MNMGGSVDKTIRCGFRREYRVSQYVGNKDVAGFFARIVKQPNTGYLLPVGTSKAFAEQKAAVPSLSLIHI